MLKHKERKEEREKERKTRLVETSFNIALRWQIKSYQKQAKFKNTIEKKLEKLKSVSKKSRLKIVS